MIAPLAKFIDCEGTGIGFLLFSHYLARQKSAVQAVAFFVAGVLVLVGLVFLSLEATFHIRGVIQRVTQVIQFTGEFFCAFYYHDKGRPITPTNDCIRRSSAQRTILPGPDIAGDS
jgi:hypothetical protein